MANSGNPDLAFDFLDKTFAGSVELYENILESSGAISTWLPAANSPVYARPQEFFGGQRIFEEIVSFAGRVPGVQFGVFNYEARDAAARALIEIIQGANIDTALETAERNVSFLMQN